MSMWSESLSLCLYDWGDNAAKRAKCILAHLAMPVPRSWWESSLERGVVGSTWAAILCDLQKELSAALNPDEPLSLKLLVALAFIDDDRAENPAGRFGDFGSRHTPDEYLARAKEILAERPDLAQLEAMIEQAAAKRPPELGL
jgi:hypothetical protein